MSNTLITELVCTRLSHDTIGTVGALANVVELLEEGDLDDIDNITSILKAGSQTLTARLKFFRMAFGLNNANLEDENLVRQIAADYLKTIGNKDFPIIPEWTPIAADKRKQALLLVMLVADILIRGGVLKIYEISGGLAAEISTTAKISAPKLAQTEQALADGKIPADATLAPLAVLADQNILNLSKTDNAIVFTLRSK